MSPLRPSVTHGGASPRVARALARATVAPRLARRAPTWPRVAYALNVAPHLARRAPTWPRVARALAFALAALAPAATAQQAVLFADDQPCVTADVPSAQAAIDAAGEGDVVFVRHGAGDEPLVVSGKSLTLIGLDELGARPVAGGASGVVVRDLAAGQAVTLRGLALEPGLLVEDCLGTVWVEDCSAGLPGAPLTEPAVRVLDSDAVVLVRCDVAGAAGGPQAAADALELDGGRVFAYGSTFAGGDATTKPGPGADGGHGVRVRTDGWLLLDDCLAAGGDGGHSQTCDTGGDGGDGLHLQHVGSVAWTLAETLQAGDEGGICGPDGQPGQPLGGNGVANRTDLAGPARALDAPALAFEGQSFDLHLDTQPGDAAFLWLGLAPAPLASSALDGALLVELPGLLVPLGAAVGTLPVALPPDVVPFGMALPLTLQLLTLGGVDKRAGSGSRLTVLDAALADELDCNETLWVDDDAPGDPGPGDPTTSDPLEDGSASHPYDRIQEALDAAVDGTRVVVRDGSYDTPTDGLIVGPRSITVESEHGPDGCVIEAGQRGFLLLAEPEDSLIRGFTITGASVAALGNTFSTTRARVAECRLVDNARGLQCNEATFNDIVLRDCLITGSTREAVQTRGGQVTLERCDVRENGSPNAGVATFELDFNGQLLLRDCFVVRNDNVHGAAARVAGELRVETSTFALNPDSLNGSELHVLGPGVLLLRNTIVWGGGTSAVHVDTGGLVGADWCLIRGGAAGVTSDPGATVGLGPQILDGPPAFKNPGAGDFHLGAGSPCLDAGDPAFVPQPGQTDIDGQPRVLNAALDLGADERP